MASISNLARYEPEHSSLDYKRLQYTPEKHEDLLVDIMALANSHVVGDRHIIVGVIPVAGGPNDLRGVDPSSIVDDAIYQKLVRDNIEPEIGFSYTAEQVDGVVLGVFRLFGYSDRPYTMRKDFGKLRRGMGYIRKGTHQALLTRDDLDQIYSARAAASRPQARAVFDALGDPTVIEIVTASAEPLPSQRAAAEITAILEDRARRTAERKAARESSHAMVADFLGDTINNPHSVLLPPGYALPYEHRSTDDLRDSLAEVRKSYADDDAYEIYEKRAAKINVKIVNSGIVGVDRAAFELSIVPPPTVLVARELAREPFRVGGFIGPTAIGYPECERDGVGYVFRAVVGDVRPGQTVRVFEEPIRVTAGIHAAGAVLSLSYRILAQNIDRPIRGSLTINVAQR